MSDFETLESYDCKKKKKKSLGYFENIEQKRKNKKQKGDFESKIEDPYRHGLPEEPKIQSEHKEVLKPKTYNKKAKEDEEEEDQKQVAAQADEFLEENLG
ncbi:MAG: hypothetical protein ABII07_03575 [Patescibacteria group bacterium]|nr:hypothetical protein [Patescibacteria group bacterium]